MDVILASASPRRLQLLALLGINAQQIPADVDESLPANTALLDGVKQLAKRKAIAVASIHNNALIVAADTLVALDGRLFAKPLDENDAREMLYALSGKTHEVATGFCVCHAGKIVCDVQATRVTMADADDALINAYIASGEPFGKAGAYAVQGKGALLVSRIDGDFYNVVGLPIFRLARVLREFMGEDFLKRLAENNDG